MLASFDNSPIEDASTGGTLKMAGQFKFLVLIADYEPLSNKFNDDRRICALTIAQTYLQQTRKRYY